MRLIALASLFLIGACTSTASSPNGNGVAMRYSHQGFSVDEEAARAHRAFEERLADTKNLIVNKKPIGAPISLIYVENTINLVDTPTSFTRDMGGPQAPTARIAAAQQFRGTALRVIDPEHFSANMSLDCQNTANGARVFQLKTYVSNYDPAVRRSNRGLAPYLQDGDTGFDVSRQSGTTTDVFSIETELTDCFGNVLRAISPVVEVTSVTHGQSVFFFSEFFGIYADRSNYVSNNLNGAKKRAIELVVAEIGLYIAGVPESEISKVFAPSSTALP